MMRRHHTSHLIQIDINPCGLCAGSLVCWWGLFDAETIGAVVGDVEPGQSRDFQAFFWAAMTTVPEAVKAIGLLPALGDKTGINDQGLGMCSRDHLDDRRLVEGDKVKVSGVPTCQGLFVIRTVAGWVRR